MIHLTTYWVRAEDSQVFLGALECYLTALERLGVLRCPPNLASPEPEGNDLRITFRLDWKSPRDEERAAAHGRVRPIKRRLHQLSHRQRLVSRDALPASA